ncbi:hypothetical protein [Actinokineospora cianjurensis]|uniref:WD40 repeat protein n=1 Tax=Actinokineospora cianjurensis TaxID=585224 RepID=A0A421B6P6_9PSEU|nr:hypothetical protein [Actinokineospora cianjurensis]RLK59968.1 hypothetical protein CLV68_0459 [Actinokineospora cianjurensis]
MSGMRVLDVDEQERVLIALPTGGARAAGGAPSTGGEVRLVEVDAKGKSRELAAVADAAAARYLPGERKVVVQHGTPARLSLVQIGGKLTPLVGSDDHANELLGVLPGRIVYRTNRKHRLLYSVVIRNVLVGEEQAVYDRGGAVIESAVSPNSRYIAIRLPRKLLLVDTMPVTEDDHVRLISAEPAARGRANLRWLPDSARLTAVEYEPESARVVRFDVASESWHPLVVSLDPTARGWTAPDGRRVAVAVGNELSLYQTDNGRFLRSTTVDGEIEDFHWSPDSRAIALRTTTGHVAVVRAESAATRLVQVG